VNDTLGGPQGIQVRRWSVRWNFNSPIRLGPFTASFYFSYLLLALALLAASFRAGAAAGALVDRAEHGRDPLDEVASACYGLDIARWKVLAFTLGNFLAGCAGAVYGHVLVSSRPTISPSATRCPGLDHPAGRHRQCVGRDDRGRLRVILPEKLQIIQEYRFASMPRW